MAGDVFTILNTALVGAIGIGGALLGHWVQGRREEGRLERERTEKERAWLIAGYKDFFANLSEIDAELRILAETNAGLVPSDWANKVPSLAGRASTAFRHVALVETDDEALSRVSAVLRRYEDDVLTAIADRDPLQLWNLVNGAQWSAEEKKLIAWLSGERIRRLLPGGGKK